MVLLMGASSAKVHSQSIWKCLELKDTRLPSGKFKHIAFFTQTQKYQKETNNQPLSHRVQLTRSTTAHIQHFSFAVS